MPKRIFKYNVPQELGAHNVLLPSGYNLLDIQFQDQDLVLWAEVDPTVNTKSSFMYAISFTGEEVIPYYKHYKTIQHSNRLVYHVYTLETY